MQFFLQLFVLLDKKSNISNLKILHLFTCSSINLLFTIYSCMQVLFHLPTHLPLFLFTHLLIYLSLQVLFGGWEGLLRLLGTCTVQESTNIYGTYACMYLCNGMYIFICMCLCRYIYIMHVCICIFQVCGCMYVGMYSCLDVYLNICMHVRMYVRTYACMHVRISFLCAGFCFARTSYAFYIYLYKKHI